MKTIYTDKDLTEFYLRFKSLSDYMKVEAVAEIVRLGRFSNLNKKQSRFRRIHFYVAGFILFTGLTAVFFIQSKNELSNKTNNYRPIISSSSAPGNQRFVSVKESSVTRNVVAQAGNSSVIAENNLTQSNNSGSTNLDAGKSGSMDLIGSIIKQKGIPVWPEDSIITGEQFIITLTAEEAREIGILINPSGTYFRSISGSIIAHTCGYLNGKEVGSESRYMGITWPAGMIITNDDYRAVLETDRDYRQSIFSRDSFALINDTLLPIKFKKADGYCSEGVVAWFTATKSLFKKLPARYQYLNDVFIRLKSYKRRHPSEDIVQYGPGDVKKYIKMVELTTSELMKLGFIFRNDSIGWPCIFSKTEIVLLNLFNMPGVHVNILPADALKDIGIKTIFISNEYGEQNIRFQGIPQNPEIYSLTEFLNNKPKLMVPVLLKKKDYPNQLYENQIFWLEASETLFNVLPPGIGDQIRNEYYFINASAGEKAKNASVSCTYFEECKSNLLLEDFNLYPNPSKGPITLNFTISEETKGNISLINLSGIRMKYLSQNSSFEAGLNLFNFDLSDVTSGIYLILIESAKGKKISRIIIAH